MFYYIPSRVLPNRYKIIKSADLHRYRWTIKDSILDEVVNFC